MAARCHSIACAEPIVRVLLRGSTGPAPAPSRPGTWPGWLLAGFLHLATLHGRESTMWLSTHPCIFAPRPQFVEGGVHDYEGQLRTSKFCLAAYG